MARKHLIPKTREQRISECETHVYFLWDALRLYPKQRDRYKQIASELRILVAERRERRRILIRLMQELGFSFNVQPPGPPLDKQPIPMVGWRDDPEYQALANEAQNLSGDKEALDALLDKQAAMRRPVPFPEYVDKALAVYVAPYDYSYRELVLAIAQQVGGSHEDTTVEEPIVRLSHFFIGGHEGHITPLISFAKLVTGVGAQFIAFVAKNHGYRPRYSIDAG